MDCVEDVGFAGAWNYVLRVGEEGFMLPSWTVRKKVLLGLPVYTFMTQGKCGKGILSTQSTRLPLLQGSSLPFHEANSCLLVVDSVLSIDIPMGHI